LDLKNTDAFERERVMTSKIGKNVDSWCTHCGLILAHTIEIMAGARISRVHCNTCGAQHAYRASAPSTRTAPPAVRTARVRAPRSRNAARSSKEQAARTRDYEALVRGRTAAAARVYSAFTRFKVGDLLSHAAFGLGAVTGERDNVKLDVLFVDGPRVLLHGRDPASSPRHDTSASAT
jgi:hypothetical protein